MYENNLVEINLRQLYHLNEHLLLTVSVITCTQDVSGPVQTVNSVRGTAI